MVKTEKKLEEILPGSVDWILHKSIIPHIGRVHIYVLSNTLNCYTTWLFDFYNGHSKSES